MTRPADLQNFLDLSAKALQAATRGQAARAAERAVALWSGTQGAPGVQAPARLPVCDWLRPALAAAEKRSWSDLAAAFAAIEPQLTWRRRALARPEDRAFWNGHANAMILGPGGLEERADLWLGATVMAPNVTYADHEHPPEEIYLPLAPGEWWNAKMDWTDPGPEGAIYNSPGILHKMRAGHGPFLALWFLPV
ncbi:MAG: dimethylsulfoniopropionate lyase [Tabrizicola sp.]|jgi:hypothetical protein|nr:dimethylsulfoniopropionate lyase [Tabrizicola sp.]